MEIIHAATGHPILDRLCEETLAAEWWDDAESRHEDGINYLMVVDRNHPSGMLPVAWAGWRVEDENGAAVLRCCNNYVRRTHRGHVPDWYSIAYLARHRLVVQRLGMPAVTYLYEQPIWLHELDGWVKDTGPGSSGVSHAREGGEPHPWWRLRLPPRDQFTTGPIDC